MDWLREPMPNLLKLPSWGADGVLHVVVETPRGARAKFKFDPDLDAFVLSKSLMLGLSYPYDWGFVPSTLADDGDPLDAMVVHDAATTPGMVIKCRILGVLEVAQTANRRRQRNDRLFVVPAGSLRERETADVGDLAGQVRRELERFFAASVALEDKRLKILGWKGPAAATRLVEREGRRFRKAG
jgi:inorganic pyrophosphatase